MSSPVAELLRDLSRAFAELDVSWYLFGAQAALLYGAARLTADVDVTVRLSERAGAEALVEQLEKHGFRLRAASPTFIQQTRVLPVVHEASGMPADIVLAGPGLEEIFLQRAVVHDIEGVAVPVASPEDLIVMKILAGRPKDVDDVVTILASQSDRFDAGIVRSVLQELESALGQSDLIPLFEKARARAEASRQ
jgi:hypothetical protein